MFIVHILFVLSTGAAMVSKNSYKSCPPTPSSYLLVGNKDVNQNIPMNVKLQTLIRVLKERYLIL